MLRTPVCFISGQGRGSFNLQTFSARVDYCYRNSSQTKIYSLYIQIINEVKVKLSSIVLQAFLPFSSLKSMLLPSCMRIGLQALTSHSKCQQISSATENSLLSLLQIAGQFHPDHSYSCLEESLIQESKDQRLQKIAVEQVVLKGQTHGPAAPAEQPVENEVRLEELLPKSRGLSEAQPVPQAVHPAEDRLKDQCSGEYKQELAEAEGDISLPASSERSGFSHAI